MKTLEINPKNTFAFLSLVSICLIHYIDNSIEFNKISNMTADKIHEMIADLHYMKDFFLSKAKSYTSFSILTKYSESGLALDLILQVFFKYDVSFQLSPEAYTDSINKLSFSETNREIFDLFLMANEVRKIFESKIQKEEMINLKNPPELLEKIKLIFNNNKEILGKVLSAIQQDITKELKINIENLKGFLSEKNDQLISVIVEDFVKFLLKTEILLFLSIHNENFKENLDFVDKIFITLSSLNNVQEIHGNLININDTRHYYKSLLVAYYHFLVNIFKNCSEDKHISNKIQKCLYEISNYQIEKKKITKDDKIWPFVFLLESNIQNEIKDLTPTPELLYNMSLEKMKERKLIEAKRYLQKAILINPVEKKYRETLTSFSIIFESEFIKNSKVLQFNDENKLHFLIKTIRESMKTKNRMKAFSKMLIYYQSIDIFYCFCRCLFENLKKFDLKFYELISKFLKIYLGKKHENNEKKYSCKLLKLFLEITFHFNLMISNKSILSSEEEIKNLKKLLTSDLEYIKNHQDYDEKSKSFHQILKCFYDFNLKTHSIEEVLKIFGSIKNLKQKISFLIVIVIFV